MVIDGVFSVRLNNQTAHVSLPELLGHLVTDEVESLPALRPHQWQPVHCFLVQVAALAMLASGVTSPPRDADQWLVLLRKLTPEFPNDEPWTLVVDDLSKPAFMQAPVPEGDWKALKEQETTPDALDMLVTSKAHDLKSGVMGVATAEHWIYALITLQTLEGFLGRGNYGISRMNGGFASRAFIGVKPRNGRWGAHIARDIRVLVERRGEILERFPAYARTNGMGLTWLEPWDGERPFTPSQLDPYYVEICRRVRMRNEGASLVARRGSSKAARIEFPDALNGVTGDPWVPISKGTSLKPLTVDGTGFNYRRVVDLLDSEKYQFSSLQQLDDEEAKDGAQLLFVVTVRGQGETQGFHQRRILVPPRAVPYFKRSASGSRLAKLGHERIDDASKISSKALRPALFTLLQGAPAELDFGDPKAKMKAAPLIARFEQRVDESFFERLFDELGEDAHSVAAHDKRRKWIEELRGHALDILAIAESGSPLSYIRRYRARAAAVDVLLGSIRNQFTDLFGGTP